MKLKDNLEIINENEKYYYNTEYNTLFEKTEFFNDIVERMWIISEEQIIEELKHKYNIEDIKSQILTLNKWIKDVRKYKRKVDNLFVVKKENWFNSKELDSLFMTVSHDCNLRCKYCYGECGTYGKEKKLMSVDKAKEIIDYWLKYLNKDAKQINVAFFGGEPLMNKSVIIFSVNYINNILKPYNKKVNYTITTNGTILDEEILETLVKNKFTITLSIDGGKEIHDKNRPCVSGKGSFNIIRENVSRLKKYYHKLTARMTITHENISIFSKSVQDIWDMGIDTVMYDLVSTENEKFKITKEDLKILKPQLQELSVMAYRDIESNNYKNRKFKPFYIVGKDIRLKSFAPGCAYDCKRLLMVDTKGDIFKCHRLSGNLEFTVGNISTGLDWNKYDSHNKIECNNCWANNLCHKCAETNYISTKDINKPNPILCEHRKFVIVEGIKLYLKINKNYPDKIREIYL